MRRVAMLVAGIMTAWTIFAGEASRDLPEMVVTATGNAAPIEKLGHSVTVITSDTIRSKGWRSLPEALRSAPGMHVVQTGPAGSQVSVFMRGSRSQHAVVLMDGIRVNDPSSATRSAHLADIDLLSVERIEIIRGPQSGLYGADAIGGVINIITRKAKDETEAEFEAEAGSYETYRASGRYSASKGALNAHVEASYMDTEGFSAANERFEGNDEDDGFESLNVSTKLGFKPSDTASLEAFVNYTDAENEYDAGAGPNSDDEDNKSSTERVLTGLRGIFGDKAGNWKQAISLEYGVFERVFEDGMFANSTFDGENWETEWRQDVKLGESHALAAGILYRDEKAETDEMAKQSADTVAGYAQDYFNYGQLSGVAGLRYDGHEVFDDELTYRLAPSYSFNDDHSRLKASFGTGFKAPSLYQLYAPASEWGPIGNESLEPETSTGWDVGLEHTFRNGAVSVGATYYVNDIEDQIDFVNGYTNISEVESSGVEVFTSVRPSQRLTINATYTYTSSEDKSTGEQVIRVPEDRATLDVEYALNDKGSLAASAIYVGERNDRYFDPNMFMSVDVETDEYIVVNLAGNYDLTENLSLFGRVENLFDEDYEEAYGYGTPGLSAYAGMKVSL